MRSARFVRTASAILIAASVTTSGSLHIAQAVSPPWPPGTVFEILDGGPWNQGQGSHVVDGGAGVLLSEVDPVVRYNRATGTRSVLVSGALNSKILRTSADGHRGVASNYDETILTMWRDEGAPFSLVFDPGYVEWSTSLTYDGATALITAVAFSSTPALAQVWIIDLAGGTFTLLAAGDRAKVEALGFVDDGAVGLFFDSDRTLREINTVSKVVSASNRLAGVLIPSFDLPLSSDGRYRRTFGYVTDLQTGVPLEVSLGEELFRDPANGQLLIVRSVESGIVIVTTNFYERAYAIDIYTGVRVEVDSSPKAVGAQVSGYTQSRDGVFLGVIPTSPIFSNWVMYRLPIVPRRPGSLTPVQSAVPAPATAALVNLTMAAGVANGYVTADKCTALVAGPQTKSNGNHGVGTAIANLSVVAVDPDGRFCIYNEQPVHLIADVQGYFAPSAGGGQVLVASAPIRKLDTRQPGFVRPPSGSITRVETGAAVGVTAVLANLTMGGATSAGYITADKCSALVAGPQTKSNGNHGVGTAIANLSVVPVDADGAFCIYNEQPVHLIVDIQGFFSPSAVDGRLFISSAPLRKLDTRQPGFVRPPSGSITSVNTGAAAGVTAVLINLTMTGGAAAGYVTADKCSALVAGPQTKSNGNHPAGDAIANLSVVPVDADGAFCIYNEQPVHLIVDIQGFFSPTGSQQFFPGTPTRMLDTRVD